MEKFGSREVCNVVFKAKAPHMFGNMMVSKDEPVLYFDSLKTTSLESSATPVYARGGRGNPKLITWEGEKEMTFTFEDALLSPEGMAILAGAELLSTKGHDHHIAGRVVVEADGVADLAPLAMEATGVAEFTPAQNNTTFVYLIGEKGSRTKLETFTLAEDGKLTVEGAAEGDVLLVDTYITVAGSSTINIDADKFGGTYYIEGETLFRTEDGVDHAAQLVFPNGKVQTNFSLAMANSGDPSTFTFTVDVMPDYVRGDRTKKHLVSINIVD